MSQSAKERGFILGLMQILPIATRRIGEFKAEHLPFIFISLTIMLVTELD